MRQGKKFKDESRHYWLRLDETFGSKLEPILVELQGAIYERMTLAPNIMPHYSDKAALAALCLFWDVWTERATMYYHNMGISLKEASVRAERFSIAVRAAILDNTGIDTRELTDKVLGL